MFWDVGSSEHSGDSSPFVSLRSRCCRLCQEHLIELGRLRTTSLGVLHLHRVTIVYMCRRRSRERDAGRGTASRMTILPWILLPSTGRPVPLPLPLRCRYRCWYHAPSSSMSTMVNVTEYS